jgi:hypothetical protein
MPRPLQYVVFLAILLFFACSSPPPTVSAGPPTTPAIEVFFSPRGGAAKAVVRELGNAKKEILVQAYSFTSALIAKTLVEAHRRGFPLKSVQSAVKIIILTC